MGASLTPPPSPSPEPLADVEQYLKLARDGSPAALGRALEAARNYLLRIANRDLDVRLQSKVGASDLVQDTYLEAQRSFGQFRGETEAEFFGWLSGILAHRLANSVRRFRYTKARTVDREVAESDAQGALGRLRAEAPTPGAQVAAIEEEIVVRRALERMDEQLRTILIQRTWQGASFPDIGAQHNCSADAARKLWVRAVRQMRSLLRQGDSPRMS